MDYQNIFNRDFFPTPSAVIEQMMQGEDITDAVVLEPSAGSGNIVKWCQQNGARLVLACEKNDTLRDSLFQMCNVLASDFLSLSADRVASVDYIVMNPPFSEVEKHINHAWEIAPDGCTIVTLAPHSIIENAYSEVRKALVERIELFGHHRNLKNCFSTGAERRTDCEIELIKLYKPGEKKGSMFDGVDFEQMDSDEVGGCGAGLVTHDKVRELVSRYNAAVEKFDEVQRLSEQMNDLIKPFSSCHIAFGAHGSDHTGSKMSNISADRFRRELQHSAWTWVFDAMNLRKYHTSVLQEKINAFVEQKQAIPFTRKNIYRVVSEIAANIQNIMGECLERAFDTICGFSAENSTAGEKWKTNSNYMVNKRFIVPGMSETDYYIGLNCKCRSYGYYYDQMEDVIKALHFLRGKEQENQLWRMVNETNTPWGQWIDFDWFRVRFYKKGTMHFEFTDEKMWYDFNQYVAKQRGWTIGSQTQKKRK